MIPPIPRTKYSLCPVSSPPNAIESNPAQIAIIAIPNNINWANFCKPVSTIFGGAFPIRPIFTGGVFIRFAERLPILADNVLSDDGLVGLDAASAILIGCNYT